MLLSSLPAPSREHARPEQPEQPASRALNVGTTIKEPPPYGSVERRLYRPRRQEDFGDGGAFPECRQAQFPLGMGKGDSKSQGTLAITLGSDGQVSYDAVLRQSKLADRHVASSHSALVPKIDDINNGSLAKPDEEEVEKTRAETQAALDRVVGVRIQAAQPTSLAPQPGAPTYIKYTPAQQGSQYASGAGQRIIKMQDMPVDPLEPPKFRAKKVPRASGAPPVPQMHSPPRNITAKDQADWKIPPCISNWKNPKGYTIPLDKRLAADGRGLQEVAINDNFAKMTEALYVAEQSARQAVEMRSRVQRELAAKEKEAKDRELRELAIKARMDRLGGGAAAGGGGNPSLAAREAGAVPAVAATAGRGEYEDDLPPPPPPPPGERETPAERAERQRREDIRRERARERERERRLEAKDAHGYKRSKLTRDRDRDISEKMALGQAHVGTSAETMYDQRLFNQEGGMASGLAADDTYNLYDKALFAERGSNLYRPGGGAPEEESGAAADERVRAFKPDKGFKGVDYSTAGSRGSGPVQFERDAAEADPFGLDRYVSDVRGKKNALDGIGGGGRMAASGGGGGKYEDYAGGSSRSKVDFSRGRH